MKLFVLAPISLMMKTELATTSSSLSDELTPT
ncbi:Protein of unknown function [Escherichia coli D6-113.11]|nr:Protein of unknown function [Escherichia coli D6-113.11]CDU35901.1 Protein of unknown function [Escherichia coli D6-113.11]